MGTINRLLMHQSIFNMISCQLLISRLRDITENFCPKIKCPKYKCPKFFVINVSSTIPIQALFITYFSGKVCHFLVSDIGGGGSREKMTKCDMGGSSKMALFGVTYFFAWPLIVD